MTTAPLRAMLSPSDVAELAGVGRPVVSNWRKRHADFPSAVGGTDANPLFARGDVVSWLTKRGYKIEDQTPGGHLWSAFNAIRGQLPIEDAAEFIVLLAIIKRASSNSYVDLGLTYDQIADAPPAEQSRLIESAVHRLRQTPQLPDVRLPTVALEDLQPNASLMVSAIAQIEDASLAEAVDFVLERLARWQIKGGADFGFIGSRTSALLASLITPTDRVVYDPACGIGNVLIDIAHTQFRGRLVGSEINAAALLVAAQRAFLHGVEIDFVIGDVLASDPVPTLRADTIVAEPPFGMAWDPSLNLADPRLAFGIPPRSSSDLAWVQHAIAHLVPDGRAYVMTSPSALFRSGPEKQIRANLLSAGCVEAIIGLPSKMLPHTSIGPALWVLRPRGDAGDVLLIDASDIDEVENKVADWLARTSQGSREIEAPHFRLPVAELLAGDAVLTPAKWLGDVVVDSDAISASFTRASSSMARTISFISGSALAFDQLADLPEPRITTVRELIDNGVIELHKGRPDKGRNFETDAEARIVRASHVRDGLLPPTEHLEAGIQPDLTQEGDVLVTTMNEVRALVDDVGGHLLSTGVDRLRIMDRSVITPSYLAAVITGPWNARLQAGMTIQHAPIRNLEIPLIPESDQSKVVMAQVVVGFIREQAQLLQEQAVQTQKAILNALRYNVPLDPSESSRRREDESGFTRRHQ